MRNFPGEAFIIPSNRYALPMFEKEWKNTVTRLICSSIFFLIIAPTWLRSYYDDRSTSSAPKKEGEESFSQSDINHNSKNKNNNNNKKVKKNKNEKSKASKLSSSQDDKTVTVITEDLHNGTITTTTTAASNTHSIKLNVLLFIMNAVYLCTILYIIIRSPNNETARQVIVAPALHQNECDLIIKMASNAANRKLQNALDYFKTHTTSNTTATDYENQNHQQDDYKYQEAKLISQEPKGWTKNRHDSYPTTDLNVVTDFDADDKVILRRLLDKRIAPLMMRFFGVSKDSIRAKDMFVVRYDGNAQQSLRLHTDAGHISFNILLNNEFEGGGTNFLNRWTKETKSVQPTRPGYVLMHTALLEHEGLPTTNGTRYILVGFVSIDRLDPMTGNPSSLNLFSKWLSFPWLAAYLKEALKTRLHREDNEGGGRVRGVLTNIDTDKELNEVILYSHALFYKLSDVFAPHRIVQVVDENDFDEYIEMMDLGYDQNSDQLSQNAQWFSGQNFDVGLDDRLAFEWNQGIENRHLFEDRDQDL